MARLNSSRRVDVHDRIRGLLDHQVRGDRRFLHGRPLPIARLCDADLRARYLLLLSHLSFISSIHPKAIITPTLSHTLIPASTFFRVRLAPRRRPPAPGKALGQQLPPAPLAHPRRHQVLRPGRPASAGPALLPGGGPVPGGALLRPDGPGRQNAGPRGPIQGREQEHAGAGDRGDAGHAGRARGRGLLRQEDGGQAARGGGERAGTAGAQGDGAGRGRPEPGGGAAAPARQGGGGRGPKGWGRTGGVSLLSKRSRGCVCDKNRAEGKCNEVKWRSEEEGKRRSEDKSKQSKRRREGAATSVVRRFCWPWLLTFFVPPLFLTYCTKQKCRKNVRNEANRRVLDLCAQIENMTY